MIKTYAQLKLDLAAIADISSQTERIAAAGTVIDDTLDSTESLLAGKLTTLANVGTGAGLVFRDLTTTTANLKTIKAGTNVTITNNADDITINFNDIDTVLSVASVGTGASIFQANTAGAVTLRSVLGSGLITATQNTDDVTITTTAEINTASNVGTGTGIWVSKVGSDLRFKSLIAGAGTSITNTATEITITNNVVQGFTAVSNLGLGAQVLGGSVPTITARSIIGTGLATATQNTNDITINVSRLNYCYIDLTADQTANFANGNHIEFNNIVSQRGSITVSSGAGQTSGVVTLEAGKTYLLTAYIKIIVNGSGDYGILQFYNRTTATAFGHCATCTNNSGGANRPDQPTAVAVITTTVATEIEVRVITSNSLNGFESECTSLIIQEL